MIRGLSVLVESQTTASKAAFSYQLYKMNFLQKKQTPRRPILVAFIPPNPLWYTPPSEQTNYEIILKNSSKIKYSTLKAFMNKFTEILIKYLVYYNVPKPTKT